MLNNGSSDLKEEHDPRALVVVINNTRDMALVREQGWHRIPVKRAPAQIAADLLAFYQTSAFGEEKWTIRYYASVRSYRLARRLDLLPDESDHPRAQDLYYRVDLGALQVLPRPIRSVHLRRVTFIPTTWQRLLQAQEINDLWMDLPATEKLWLALKAAGLEAERQYEVQEGHVSYAPDLTLFCRSGKIAIECAANAEPSERILGEGWAQVLRQRGCAFLRLEAQHLANPDECVRLVRESVMAYGGLDPEWREKEADS